MPGPRSCTVTLVQEVREKLEAVCRAAKSPQREVLRARIVLRASHGASNASIARELGVTADTVCKWRRRFARQGLVGLLDRQRSGRHSRFDAITRSELISLACRPVPAELCRNHWTAGELRSALLGAGLIDSISVSSVARLLSEVDLRPQRFKMWIHSPDPLFRPKVTAICALYTKAPAAGEVIVVAQHRQGGAPHLTADLHQVQGDMALGGLVGGDAKPARPIGADRRVRLGDVEHDGFGGAQQLLDDGAAPAAGPRAQVPGELHGDAVRVESGQSGASSGGLRYGCLFGVIHVGLLAALVAASVPKRPKVPAGATDFGAGAGPATGPRLSGPRPPAPAPLSGPAIPLRIFERRH